MSGIASPPRLADPHGLDRLLRQEAAGYWLASYPHVAATLIGVAVRAGRLNPQDAKASLKRGDPIEIHDLTAHALAEIGTWMDMLSGCEDLELPLTLALSHEEDEAILTIDMGCGITAYPLPLYTMPHDAFVLGLRLLAALSYTTSAFVIMQDVVEYSCWIEERLDEARCLLASGMESASDEDLIAAASHSYFLEGYEADDLRDLLASVAEHDRLMRDAFSDFRDQSHEPRAVLRDCRRHLPEMLEQPLIRDTPWCRFFRDGADLLDEAMRASARDRFDWYEAEIPCGITQVVTQYTRLEQLLLSEIHDGFMCTGESSLCQLTIPKDSLAITEIHRKLYLIGRSLGLILNTAISLEAVDS